MRIVFCFILLLLFTPTLINAEKRPDPVFYRNTGLHIIEFRVLLEDQENIPWIMMWNREGLPQRVSKEIVISNNDVAGFTIDDYKPIFDDDDGLVMHFKPRSRRKIREATGRIKGKRVAFIRDGVILLSPILYEALTRSAGVNFAGMETSSENFLKDFPTEKFPERLRSETLYEQFLLGWMKSHPDDREINYNLVSLRSPKIYEQFFVRRIDRHPEDLGALRALVHHYFEDKNNPKCNKAVPYAQKLVKLKPEDFVNQKRLMQCYSGIGDPEKALATGIQALSHVSKAEKMSLHFIVGNLQYEMGNKTEAIKSLEASLQIIRQIKIPNKDDIDRRFLSETSLQELDELVVPKKEDMIQETKDRISFIMAH